MLSWIIHIAAVVTLIDLCSISALGCKHTLAHIFCWLQCYHSNTTIGCRVGDTWIFL